MAAAYFAFEEISVFPPHVGVGGDVHGFRLERSQRAGVWRRKEGCTFPVSQQVPHELCQEAEKQVSIFPEYSTCLFPTAWPPTGVCFFLYFLSLDRAQWRLKISTI